MSTCLCKVLACSDISKYITDQKTSSARPLVTHFLGKTHSRYHAMVTCAAFVPCSYRKARGDSTKGLAFRLGASHPGTAKEVEMSSGQLDGGVAAKG